MKAARLIGSGQISIEDVPDPVPRNDDDVIVRTTHAAVCGSDLHTIFEPLAERTYPCPPGFPGHEGVGTVVHAPSARFAPGDQVLTLPRANEARTFAEIQVLRSHELVKPPGTMPAQHLLMAQQLGTAVHALNRFWAGAPPRTAALYGTGSAGLHFIQLLKHRGVDTVIAIDVDEGRLQAARRLGADILVPAMITDPVEAVLDYTYGAGADLVIEAAGRNLSRTQAMQSVGYRGTVGLFGLPQTGADPTFPFAELFRRQATITSCVDAQADPGLACFHAAIGLISDGAVTLAEHLTHTMPLDNLTQALDIALHHRNGAVKVCLCLT